MWFKNILWINKLKSWKNKPKIYLQILMAWCILWFMLLSFISIYYHSYFSFSSFNIVTFLYNFILLLIFGHILWNYFCIYSSYVLVPPSLVSSDFPLFFLTLAWRPEWQMESLWHHSGKDDLNWQACCGHTGPVQHHSPMLSDSERKQLVLFCWEQSPIKTHSLTLKPVIPSSSLSAL